MPERRIDTRMPCFLKGEILLENGERRVACEAHDISARGMRLVGPDFTKLPKDFILSIPRRHFNERVKVVRQIGPGVGVMIAESVPRQA
ncbi:PilZ domain containing protein [Rhabdaerophilaceae bacterium]